MRLREKLSAWLLSAAILLVMSTRGLGAVVYVKGDSPNPTFDGRSWETAFHKVQDGLNASQSGDEVWVAAGTYVECITLKSGVGLYGGFAGTEAARDQRDWIKNNTVVDSQQHGSVIRVPRGSSIDTQVDGFSIRNAGPNCQDAGISCWGAAVTIINNRIISNVIGVLASESSLIARNNEISSNVREGITTSSGSSSIAFNRFFGNGLAIGCWYMDSAFISSNLVVGNSSGITCCDGPATVTNNTILGSAWSGLYLQWNSARVDNNILGFNRIGIESNNASADLNSNCVYGSTLCDYSHLSPGMTDMSIDPLFRDAVNGDYRLMPDSPCIDAGTNEGAPETDLEGNPRPIDGNGDGTAVVDIGAYEYQPFRVSIDVLPGNRRNNLPQQGNKLIPVAILSTDAFDARQVDGRSVVFGRGRAREWHRTPHPEDVNNDGRIDLLFHFSYLTSGIAPGDTSVYLYGRLMNGERIAGSDTIRVVGK